MCFANLTAFPLIPLAGHNTTCELALSTIAHCQFQNSHAATLKGFRGASSPTMYFHIDNKWSGIPFSIYLSVWYTLGMVNAVTSTYKVCQDS